MNNVTRVSASEAGIDPKAISDNALSVVRKLQEAGFQAYLVGGCARDLLLGKKPKDFDVSTDARPEEVKSLFRNSRIIGRRFKIVHIRFGYEVIEVATFRANANDRDNVASHEMTEGDQGQLLRDNVYGSIEEDVIRRDFRVNALYYDPIADEILDFLGGLEDIKARKLISIGAPDQRFREDPVRMLRVIRFAAKLDFEMEPEALQMIEDEGKLLSHVSSARLFEEVLKLFHGGAAYDTYLMLRQYGLFKYLFPFTDQCVIEGAEGMPERALQNTDKRVRQGKPVIPAFLFACMMWDPVKADAEILMNDGTPEPQAWRIAMNDGLRDQNQYVAVPRRLAEIILDIWNIHFRLIKANPRMVKTSLNNRRFRAAYDFLLLRASLNEVDQDIADWWTRIQEVDPAEKEEMIGELTEVYKAQKQNRHGGGGQETDGNSVGYSDSAPTHNRRNDNAGRGRTGGGPAKQSRGGGGRSGGYRGGQNRDGQASRGGQARGGQARGGRSNTGNNPGNSAGNSSNENPGNSYGDQGSANAGNRRGGSRGPGTRGPSGGRSNAGRGNPGRGNAGGRSPSQGGRSENPFAQPKESFQVANSDDADINKVKVRHKKRRIGTKDESDTDNNPHF